MRETAWEDGIAQDDVAAWIAKHVVHHSPFDSRGLRPGLPDALPDQEDRPHEVLMKGFEVDAEEPFQDNDGTERKRIRANWWETDDDAVIRDRVQVFGHYWNMPPVEHDFAPPHPAGHPKLRRWQKRLLKKEPWIEEDVPLCRHIKLQGKAACIDFQGVTQSSKLAACVGAFRWPEREVVWGTGKRTLVLPKTSGHKWIHYDLQNIYFCQTFSGVDLQESGYDEFFHGHGYTPREAGADALAHAKRDGWDVSAIPNDLPHTPRASDDWWVDEYWNLTLCLK